MCALAPSWLLEKALLFWQGGARVSFSLLWQTMEKLLSAGSPGAAASPQSKNPLRLHVITLRLEVNPSEIRENPFKEEVITSL